LIAQDKSPAAAAGLLIAEMLDLMRAAGVAYDR
jgi:hypothetical protein